METPLAAIIVVFILLFAVLTLSTVFFNAQDVMQVNWQEMTDRLNQQGDTALSAVVTHTHAGMQVETTMRNTGNMKLADFKKWDVIVQYYDDAAPSGYHVLWLPYAETLSNNTWTVEGIYQDAEAKIAEVYDRGIFDPGEEVTLNLRLTPPIEAGSYVQLVVATDNGSSATTIFKRNVPPVLAVNNGIRVNLGKSVVVDTADLEVTDVDDTPADLVYTVTTAPQQGSLNLESFTQDDINNGLLEYDHTGTDPDSLEFTVSDGEDEIGTYTLTISVNLPPSVDVNAGMSLASGTSGAIGDLMLSSTDPDGSSPDLIYTVTTLPQQGNLSMNTFTQDDIDNAHVNYSHTGVGSDSFEFTVSDGEKTIGPFTFNIDVS